MAPGTIEDVMRSAATGEQKPGLHGSSSEWIVVVGVQEHLRSVLIRS